MAGNERITENLVRDQLRRLGYYDEEGTQIEEQKSNIVEIGNLLKGASKSGKGGVGAPEFLISTPKTPDFLVIFECKADVKRHESKDRNKVGLYAVDDVLHYAYRLAKGYNVIAVAVSGQTKSAMKVSTFVVPKGAVVAKPLTNRFGKEIDKILPLSDYIEHGSFDPEVAQNRHDDLMAFSRELHDFMRDHAKLTESEKPLLVSGTLIALRNIAFANSFQHHTPEQLQREWMRTIKMEFDAADIPNAKKYSMTQPYSSISVHPELGKHNKKFPKGVLFELIKMLNEKVYPYISIYHDFDVVGQFYGEFLKYTGGDKKALGIVLTPKHITELFSLIANVHKKSKVLDICAGTGGFLISAMHRMFQQATTKRDKERIKKHNLIGVEQQPGMYALGASNMILRGDGKANLHQGNCFDEAIVRELKAYKCDVGMLNPPYSQGDSDLHELQFVKHMLDCLQKGGTGIAIVPVSCAISSHPMREEILRYHTLDAVMSMPDDLFYPVGVVTCIMVFKAHQPHYDSGTKTWFGYWKNDGFKKTKHKGRIDEAGTWTDTRDSWIEAYWNRDDIAGESVKVAVTHEDEWCAEAYMETDYKVLEVNHFKQVALNYLAFFIYHDKINLVTQFLTKLSPSKGVDLKCDKWTWFEIQDLFEIRKGRRLTKSNMTRGNTPFIGAIDSNNGYREFVGQKPIHDGNTITVNYNGSVAEAFYQPNPFWASDDVNVLYPKFEMNEFTGLFIATIIRLEKYRFSYGRKWHMERMNVSKIKLPTKGNNLDLVFMEKVIKSLPFNTSL